MLHHHHHHPRRDPQRPTPHLPVTHALDEARGLVITTISGSVDVEALRTAILTVSQLPGFREELSQLVDLSGCTEIRATAEEVRTLASLRTVRAAYRVYVAPAPHVFGIARMYEMLLDDGRMRIVATPEEGRAWLATRARLEGAREAEGEDVDEQHRSGSRSGPPGPDPHV